MYSTMVRALALVLVAAGTIGLVGQGAVVAETPANVKPYTKQGFLEAAHDNCMVVQNREPRACKCEQKLVDSDRLSEDEKQMAFYYWTNRDEFKKRFDANKKADPEWPAAFSKKFTELQALIISACGIK